MFSINWPLNLHRESNVSITPPVTWYNEIFIYIIIMAASGEYLLFSLNWRDEVARTHWSQCSFCYHFCIWVV